MVKSDTPMEATKEDIISPVFKLGGGIDINTIPGHYPNEDYELAMTIIKYRDSINNLRSSSEPNSIDEWIKNTSAAMLDVTKAVEKLKLAKQLDGVKTLEPHEIAYLNIAAGLNQIFKSVIERIEKHADCTHKE